MAFEFPDSVASVASTAIVFGGLGFGGRGGAARLCGRGWLWAGCTSSGQQRARLGSLRGDWNGLVLPAAPSSKMGPSDRVCGLFSDGLAGLMRRRGTRAVWGHAVALGRLRG